MEVHLIIQINHLTLSTTITITEAAIEVGISFQLQFLFSSLRGHYALYMNHYYMMTVACLFSPSFSFPTKMMIFSICMFDDW